MGYFATAITEALLVGALCGLVGVLVVLRRRAFFAMALTHSTFPGAVLAVVLGIAPALGAAVFSLALVAVMTALAAIPRLGGQVASGVVLTSGFAVGTLLRAMHPELPIQVESFLVGSILTVDSADVWMTGVMLLLALAVIVAFGKELLFSTFDAAASRAAGYRPWLAELVSLVLVAGTVVVAMPAVGSILAIALIVGPAAAAKMWSHSVIGMVISAPVVGAVVGVGGLLLSGQINVGAGGVITLLAAVVFVVALIVRSTVARVRSASQRRSRAASGVGREEGVVV